MVKAWVELKGYSKRYRVSDQGDFERWVRKRGWVPLKVGPKAPSPLLEISLNKHGSKRYMAARVMYEAWNGEIQRGMEVRYMDGNPENLDIENLYIENRGWQNEKPVEKVAEDGTVLAEFKSISTAARECYFSPQAIWTRCNGRMKYPFKNTGFTFRYKGGRENVEND